MPKHNIAILIQGDEIMPRLDLATEVVILKTSARSNVVHKQFIVLPRSSAEAVCSLLLSEKINTLICGAIEDEYYEFLQWKKIEVFDNIAGAWSHAFERWQSNTLNSGDILCVPMVEGRLI